MQGKNISQGVSRSGRYQYRSSAHAYGAAEQKSLHLIDAHESAKVWVATPDSLHPSFPQVFDFIL
jgi:hypothetical protein